MAAALEMQERACNGDEPRAVVVADRAFHDALVELFRTARAEPKNDALALPLRLYDVWSLCNPCSICVIRVNTRRRVSYKI